MTMPALLSSVCAQDFRSELTNSTMLFVGSAVILVVSSVARCVRDEPRVDLAAIALACTTALAFQCMIKIIVLGLGPRRPTSHTHTPHTHARARARTHGTGGGWYLLARCSACRVRAAPGRCGQSLRRAAWLG